MHSAFVLLWQCITNASACQMIFAFACVHNLSYIGVRPPTFQGRLHTPLHTSFARDPQKQVSLPNLSSAFTCSLGIVTYLLKKMSTRVYIKPYEVSHPCDLHHIHSCYFFVRCLPCCFRFGQPRLKRSGSNTYAYYYAHFHA